MKFWKARAGEGGTIHFLDSPAAFDSYWLNGAPVPTAKQGERRYYLPALQDGEVRTVSFNQELHDLIVETGRRLVRELETQRLLDSQRDAAQRFKVSKLIYGAKR